MWGAPPTTTTAVPTCKAHVLKTGFPSWQIQLLRPGWIRSSLTPSMAWSLTFALQWVDNRWGLERVVPWGCSFLLPLLLGCHEMSSPDPRRLLHLRLSQVTAKRPKSPKSQVKRIFPSSKLSPQVIVTVGKSLLAQVYNIFHKKTRSVVNWSEPFSSLTLIVSCPHHGSFYMSQGRLELVILLPQPPKHCGSECMPASSASLFALNVVSWCWWTLKNFLVYSGMLLWIFLLHPI